MSKKLTTEEFIEKAKEVHGDKYDYSLVEYKGYSEKIKVICSKHDIFEVQPRSHLKSECSKCSVLKRTTIFEDFVNKSNDVHNSKYLYDENTYTNTNNKLNIFCKEHGWFKQMGHQHLSGKSCRKCSNELAGSTQRLTQEEFITRAIELHGDKYGYGKAIYKNSSKKVIIWCNKCEREFKQIASAHLRHGCKSCSDKNNGVLSRKSNEEYIKDVFTIHNNYYSYEKTKYSKVYDMITVTCPIHGDFEIRASIHITGSGCKPCSKHFIKYNGWQDSTWVEAGKNSKNFVAFQVYIIKCTNIDSKESFYKIGKTYLNIKYRFSGKVMPYKYEILKVIEGDGIYISKLEKELHKRHKEYIYSPKVQFPGHTECYNLQLPVKDIITL